VLLFAGQRLLEIRVWPALRQAAAAT
jgi:hypothetical protein